MYICIYVYFYRCIYVYMYILRGPFVGPNERGSEVK